MIKTIETLVCDICGKETIPLIKNETPTACSRDEPGYGWKSLDLSEANFVNRDYLDYCSAECAKKQIDNIWNNILEYKIEEL